MSEYEQMKAIFKAEPHQLSPNALREMCRQYDPFAGRWYYRLPDIMRAGMEQQGYDADDFFAKASANWGDPNVAPTPRAGGES